MYTLCIYRLESVPGEHSRHKTIYSSFRTSACSHHCEFCRHSCCDGLARDLASWWSVWVLPAFTHDRVRARGVAGIVFFSLDDPALQRDQASRVVDNGFRFAFPPLAIWQCMNTLIPPKEVCTERATASASFLAEISVSSSRKLFIFIIYKNIFRIKVSKKQLNWFWKKKHWQQRCADRIPKESVDK